MEEKLRVYAERLLGNDDALGVRLMRKRLCTSPDLVLVREFAALSAQLSQTEMDALAELRVDAPMTPDSLAELAVWFLANLIPGPKIAADGARLLADQPYRARDGVTYLGGAHVSNVERTLATQHRYWWISASKARDPAHGYHLEQKGRWARVAADDPVEEGANTVAVYDPGERDILIVVPDEGENDEGDGIAEGEEIVVYRLGHDEPIECVVCGKGVALAARFYCVNPLCDASPRRVYCDPECRLADARHPHTGAAAD